MARTVTLRPWQKAALERLAASDSPDFLAVATPGAGKTTFALMAARQALADDPARRLLVVVPTAHLKVQWSRAALAFDLHLDPQWSAADGALPGDMHGVVMTYQQVAGCAGVIRGLAAGGFVIFDEIHHAADDRAWGEAVRTAFEPAARRLALSGTPFRSDVSAIPFVRYRHEEAVADYEYGYGDALADGGVVRPVYFPRIDGMMEWTAPDGSFHSHSFDDPLDAARAGQRLRTAYSLEGEWLPHVLRQAHDQLLAIRARQPDAAGLVIATDQDHAKGIALLFRQRFGVRAVVATSDDPEASSHISRFAAGTDPWIVAVRMVSEGRRHPPAAGRGVRHHDHHRALLPPGGGPPRALDPGRAGPEIVPVHPRRAPPAGPGLLHRRAAPPLAAPRGPGGRAPGRAGGGGHRAGAGLVLRPDLGRAARRERRRRVDGRRGRAGRAGRRRRPRRRAPAPARRRPVACR